MRDAQPAAVYLKDYASPDYLINRTELHFELHEDHALVTSRLYMLRCDPGRELPLVLNGVALEVMANSDNVLRAGLTPKYIDVPELLANLHDHHPIIILIQACPLLFAHWHIILTIILASF